MKIYTSRSEIAVNVVCDGHKLHVKFMPVSSGGSLYATSDEALQRALEAHPRFGTLFRMEAEKGELPAPAQAKPPKRRVK